jgi:hypothetical protein
MESQNLLKAEFPLGKVVEPFLTASRDATANILKPLLQLPSSSNRHDDNGLVQKPTNIFDQQSQVFIRNEKGGSSGREANIGTASGALLDITSAANVTDNIPSAYM